jgi:hypothetical protein
VRVLEDVVVENTQSHTTKGPRGYMAGRQVEVATLALEPLVCSFDVAGIDGTTAVAVREDVHAVVVFVDRMLGGADAVVDGKRALGNDCIGKGGSWRCESGGDGEERYKVGKGSWEVHLGVSVAKFGMGVEFESKRVGICSGLRCNKNECRWIQCCFICLS